MVTPHFSPDDLPSVRVGARRSSPPPPLPPVYRRKPVRSVESRVFWGVLLALLVFSGLSAVGYAIRVAVATAAVRQAQAQLWEQDRQFEQQTAEATRELHAQQEAQNALRLRQAAYEHSRYVLAGNQRCVGGSVVEVDGNAYTQVGSISQPVHCTGRLADRPLR